MNSCRARLGLAKLAWLWGLVWAVGFAWADPVPMSAGGQPLPIGSESVSILEETLSIEVRFHEMRVEAVLLLESQDEAPNFAMGFPCSTREDPQMTGLGCKTKLFVRVDGVPQKLIRKKTSQDTQHWVWTTRFEPRKPVRVDVSYTQPMVNDRYGLPLAGMGALTYQLSTGARWAGPIHKLDMRVSIPVETVAAIVPSGYVREAGQIHWSLADFEPPGDVVVLLTPMETSLYLSAFRTKDYATLLKHKKAGAFDRKSLQELARRLTQDHDNLYKQARFLWSVLPVLRTMPMPSPEEVRACLEESARLMLSE
jgi:hypothetical protein